MTYRDHIALRSRVYTTSQLLIWAIAGWLLWIAFSDWNVMRFQSLAAGSFAIGLIWFGCILFSEILFGTEIERRRVSFTLPTTESLDFSVRGCTSARFVISCRNTNLLNFIGTIAVTNGTGKVIEQLQMNRSSEFDESESDAEKIIRIRRGGKGARLIMTRRLALSKIERSAPTARVKFDLDWHPKAHDRRTKVVSFDVVVRAKKDPIENASSASQVLLN